MDITVSYSSLDGGSQKRNYKTLKGARAFAHKWVGETPTLGGWYAVSFDGIGKITVEGCSLLDLFPKLAPEPEPLPDPPDWMDPVPEGEPAPPPPKYAFDTKEEAEEAYNNDMESWHECYAEAGSSWVFGGGNPLDASLAASQSVGPKPKRADYGLGPVEYATSPSPVVAIVNGTPKTADDFDDDIPF